MPEVKTERVLKILIGFCLVLLVYAIVISLHEPSVNVNDTAPGFTVTTDDGKVVSRSDFPGKLLVLNFWATWCPPCIDEMPSLDQFQRMFDGSVVVLGISVDRNETAYTGFLKRAPVSFLTSRDPEAKISSRYGTFKFPETYVIDRRGKVVEKFIGPADWTDEKIVRRIKALLEQT